MVTKAGVPANKLIIGMALYGRSFRMTEEGCSGPDCKYVGPDSAAAPGRCTETQGYLSNYEIREIIARGGDIQQIADDDGDILVYNGLEWVSWLTKSSYDSRVSWVTGLNFGGTSDWAIDLDGAYDVGDGPGSPGGPGTGLVYISPDIYDEDDPVVSCNVFPCTFIFPPWVLPSATTISPEPTTITFQENWSTTMTLDEEVITTTAGSVTSTVITPSPVTVTTIDVWNIVWNEDDDDIIYLTSSITLPPITLTKTYTSTAPPDSTTSSDSSTTSDTHIWRPPITWTYSPGPIPAIPVPTGPGPNPPPGPPPLPPPPGFPASVSATVGDPDPTCKPGQKCGGPCRSNCDSSDSGCFGICGCIGICPPGGNCVGPGCSGGGGGGGGGGDGGPDDDGPTTCQSRTTASFCQEECTVVNLPATTTTYCSEDCTQTITACEVTGSTTTTTTTISCPAAAETVNWSPDDQVPLLGDGGYGGEVADSGDYSYSMPSPTKTTATTTTTTSSSKPTDPPFPTFLPPDGTPYCFRSHNENNRYQPFTDDAGNDVINRLCDVADSLSPDNTFGHAFQGAGGLIASVTWAKNQDGCQPKADNPLGDYCRDTFRWMISECDDFDRDASYGGAFVDNADYGCVEWYLGIDSENLQKRDVAAGQLKSEDMLLDMVGSLEPELPRLSRVGGE